uniref:Large ribosomal RNA subunit accumulation protein YCED homolog 2, chloroplastic n=1 Tax=Cucumis sativus TaxID=3659 RepID=A0A0A0L9P4_CUCSA
MAEAGHLVTTARNINSISSSFNKAAPKPSTQTFKIKASSKRNDISLVKHNLLLVIFQISADIPSSIHTFLFHLMIFSFSSLNEAQIRNKTTRRLITISTAGSRWQGKWTCDYLLSLRDLNLEDLVEDENNNAHVFINLCIEKHASFGFTVDGRINTSFTRKCCACSSPYCREINANFNVLVLSSNRANREIHLPDIGGDDPSVIYVKPGLEADLDSLVRDTIRLTTSTKDTCSEMCEKSQPTVQYIGAQNAASIDKRWSRLLELRKSNS